MTTFWLPTRAATADFGTSLGSRLQSGDVLALVGDLGTGKTTLTQAIARGMGITSDVASPTFALIHEYPGPTPLFHFDPYRLDRPEDLADLGFEEYFERGGVVIVEWADKVAGLLPPERLLITLEIPDEAEVAETTEDLPRRLHVEGVGERYLILARDLGVPINDPSDGQPSYGRKVELSARGSIEE